MTVAQRLERQDVDLETPVQLRSVTPSGLADVGESGLAVTQLPCAEGVRIPPPARVHAFVAQRMRAPGSEPGGRWFDSSRGRAVHGSVSEWPGAGLQNQSRRFESGRNLDCCPLWTISAGERWGSAAPHKGSPPGSSPGPATRTPIRASSGNGWALRSTARCEAQRLLHYSKWKPNRRSVPVLGRCKNLYHFLVRRLETLISGSTKG